MTVFREGKKRKIRDSVSDFSIRVSAQLVTLFPFPSICYIKMLKTIHFGVTFPACHEQVCLSVSREVIEIFNITDRPLSSEKG